MNKLTPLFTWHRSHGAKKSPFAGWDMPIQYHTGAIQEQHLVRWSAGVFDISHMGRVRFSGASATAALQRLLSADIASIGEGMSSYALLCRDDGTVIDELTGGAASKLARFACAELTIDSIPMLVGRTGYTGEDGFELFPPSSNTQETHMCIRSMPGSERNSI